MNEEKKLDHEERMKRKKAVVDAAIERAQDAVVKAIRNRPSMQSVILTGRAAKPELIDLADTVSEIRDVKHAFKAGVKAQSGIDF